MLKCLGLEKLLKTFGGRFDIPRKVARLEEISEMEALEGFWQDADNAAKIQREKSVLQSTVKSYSDVKELLDEFDILHEYASEGDDDSAGEALEVYEKLKSATEELEKQSLLSDEMDPNNAIVSINAGAGGTESCDWAGMLHRMLTRWAESKGFKVDVMDYQYGDSAGIKSVTMMVSGNFAYGLMKSESGIHRLVRISPFDSNARRHTSFASVFVSPEVDDSIEIEVQDKDLRIDVYRSGGAGGQSVNTTDSAVRITHLPTNIVVTCQNERSQLQNKQTAMKILKSRLYEKAMEEKRAEQAEAEANKKEIGWGSQIRSYVLHPYKMVKDHRTNQESGNAEKVLDGDLDNFMKAYLQWSKLSDQEGE
ncbi:MAG: peptide chain release factor 2 [Halobacteriovoraceae bacterium]|nr:peptide chain release factor 2 [Peredibacter sp.]MBJ00873.1 peptide chain release factor 2 [Halobacteriovoraceae bacterium]